MKDNEELELTIDCIGVDEKLHLCLPSKNVTTCGIKIRSKIVKSKDWATRNSCYECTYDNED